MHTHSGRLRPWYIAHFSQEHSGHKHYPKSGGATKPYATKEEAGVEEAELCQQQTCSGHLLERMTAIVHFLNS